MRKSQTEPYISTYLHAKGRQQGLPIAGNFELTARCNFNCPMCYVHLSESDVQAAGRELTAAQWLQIAKDARDRGMMFVLLTGGEPFVRKDFFKILHGMQDLGLFVSINSNGSMLSGKIREQLLERIWGITYDGGTRTVDVHVQTLRTKLGLCSHMVETVRGVGYRFGGGSA